MKLFLIRYAAFAGIVTMLVAAAFAYYLPIQDSYHPLNTNWNGCSEIAQIYSNTTLLTFYDQGLSGGRGPLLAIIGPTVAFTAGDALAIRNFLEAGGTVLLADNFGTGNQLLQALNVKAQISGRPLADVYFYARDSQFPIAYSFSPSQLTANLTEIVFNHPSYLLSANSSLTILASSSPFSFIDLDQGHPAPNETVASYPMIATTNIGKGSLIIITDPNIFTNEMLGLLDNSLLFHNLMIGHNRLIIDVAHLRTAPLTSARIQLKQEIGLTRDFLFLSQSGVAIQWITLIAIILGFSLEIVRRMRRLRSGYPSSLNHA